LGRSEASDEADREPSTAAAATAANGLSV